jgi:hypothetical protein
MGFLLLHLANHVAALWTVSVQSALMTVLRLWYRSPWVQPVILALLAVMVLTGVLQARRYTASTCDAFRVAQTVSGAYIGAFIGAHSAAVFIGRSHGLDTNWDFAVGGTLGLLHEPFRATLLVYYALAVFLIVVHLALGLRITLLAHHWEARTADRLAKFGAAAGILLSSLIMAAALGVHVAS